jgi:ribosomal protein S18 acetylase RimI-like enzyme
MENITIRRANTNDIELIATLGRSTFFNTFDGTCTKDDMQYFLNKYFNHDQVNSELTDAQDYFFIASLHEKAIGYYRIKIGGELPFDELKQFNSIELKRFYFLKEAQGTGAAKVLIHHAFDFVKQKGYNKMYLSVWEYNIRAQEFYKKMGFANTQHKNDFPLGNTPQTDFWFWKDL